MAEISEVPAGKLSPLQVDSPAVPGVARGLRMKVEVEGSCAGDHVVLPSGHTEGVEDIATEPDTVTVTCIHITSPHFSVLTDLPGEGLVRVPAVHVGVRDEKEVVPVSLTGVGRVAVTAAANTVQVPAVWAGGGAQLETAVANLSPHTHCVVQASWNTHYHIMTL